MPPICVYGGFAAEWEHTTGVPQATVLALANHFCDGIAQRLPRDVAVPDLVLDAALVPPNAVILFACALGTETSSTFAASCQSAAAPALWDWISSKHTYLSALAAAGVPVPPTWVVLGASAACALRAREVLVGSETSVGASGEQEVKKALEHAWRGADRLVVKQCLALGGTVAVERLIAAEAVSRALALAAEGHDVLVQPDLRDEFAVGEHKCCVEVGGAAGVASRVLGARHAPPGCEFGRCLMPAALPAGLRDVAARAADQLRDHALDAGVTPPPVIRVDCVQLSGVWCVNEFELADYASWQWGLACNGVAGPVDNAVCDALARFATRASRG